ncbi:MAG: hypothetical protein KC731_04375 [Myxococcales bacterium]|nr:hypothetical protein [Myxococcales bacterium]
MRWECGSNKQLAFAHGLIVLRMIVFGAVLFLILKPWLMAGVTPHMGSGPEILEHAILAALAVGFAIALLRGAAGVSWAELGIERRALGRNVVLVIAPTR